MGKRKPSSDPGSEERLKEVFATIEATLGEEPIVVKVDGSQENVGQQAVDMLRAQIKAGNTIDAVVTAFKLGQLTLAFANRKLFAVHNLQRLSKLISDIQRAERAKDKGARIRVAYERFVKDGMPDPAGKTARELNCSRRTVYRSLKDV